MPPTPRAVAEVDLDAIADNVRALRGHAGDAAVMAVVKADAYGHGMVPCARAALAGGATWLGTAFVEEALALRAAGIAAPVMTWLASPGEPWDAAVEQGIDVSAGAPWLVEEVATSAARVGRPARLHLEADSGLSRGGARPEQWKELVGAALAAQDAGTVTLVGLWSHLACADDPDHPATAEQVRVFTDLLAEAHRWGARPQVRHLANSAATLAVPAARLDLVRTGIATYGISPGRGLGAPADWGLRPAMTLTARLAMVKDVPAGASVSYGHIWTAPRDTTVGLVPLGYADGIPRQASGTAVLRTGGLTARSVGRICMDQFVVELDPAGSFVAGDEIEVFGRGDDGGPTAEDWAQAAGTIGYDIVTGIGARVPRRYVGSAGVPAPTGSVR